MNQDAATGKFAVSHGHACRDPKTGKTHKSLTYQSWSSMNDRCYLKSHKWHHMYGGRGIQVCERWRRGTKDTPNPGAFSRFLEDVGERPSKLLTLDRWPNVNGNYEKGNVLWSDKVDQRAHQRPRTPTTDNTPIETPAYMSGEDELAQGDAVL